MVSLEAVKPSPVTLVVSYGLHGLLAVVIVRHCYEPSEEAFIDWLTVERVLNSSTNSFDPMRFSRGS
jgi:hypothetical protein